jgi:hypothetical protein
MKKENLKAFILLLFVSMLSSIMIGQTSVRSEVLPNLNYLTPQDEVTTQKKDKKRKDEFKVFGGVNFNNLKVDNDLYETTTGVGWLLGASYKRGKFLYWELGGRYNRAVYDMTNYSNPGDSTSTYFDRIFGVSNVDVPITFGINFLSVVSRIVGLRIYVSAVPAFVLGVSDNDLNITKDRLNTFIFSAQGGVGVDVTFIFLEVGVNYGFNDLFKDYNPSHPVQGFVNLGFRF